MGLAGYHLRAEFELVTPAFCGGAGAMGNINPEDPAEYQEPGPAELRLPAIFGPLQWWWRSLAWARTGGGEEPRLDVIRHWEKALFGSGDTGTGFFTAKLETIGARTFARSVPGTRAPEDFIGGYLKADLPTGKPWQDWQKKGAGLRYLANQGLYGQGLVRDANGDFKTFVNPWRQRQLRKQPQDHRACVPAGTRFTLDLLCREDPTAPIGSAGPSLVEAIRLFGALGGIGTRSRRGFGSVQLINLAVVRLHDKRSIATGANLSDHEAELRSLLGGMPSRAAGVSIAYSAPGGAREVPYSAFSGNSAVVVVRASNVPPGQAVRVIDLHNEMGHRLQHYRSWHGAKQFPADHKWFNVVTDATNISLPSLPGKALKAKGSEEAPVRSAAGLPHNYFRPPRNGNPKMHAKVSAPESDRRASPLLLHIHAFDNAEPVAVWTLLESRFLWSEAVPSGFIDATLTVAAGRGHLSSVGWTANYRPDYSPLGAFLTADWLGSKMTVILRGNT